MTNVTLRSWDTVRSWLRRGDPFVWLASTGLAVALLMIFGMIGIILTNGLGFFWPKRIERVELKDGTVWQGERSDQELVTLEGKEHRRFQLRAGNRDISGQDFVWVDEADVARTTFPDDVWVIERREYGALIGTPAKVIFADGGETEAGAELAGPIQSLLAQGASSRHAIERAQQRTLGPLNASLETARLNLRALEKSKKDEAQKAAARASIESEIAGLEARYAEEQAKVAELIKAAEVAAVVVRTPGGDEKTVRGVDLFRAYSANSLRTWDRVSIYASRLLDFLRSDPRESNTEGGIFPALFGTVMMVLLMTVAAVPFGVVTAIYLREYATQGSLVRIVRIAVNNLAGVPSIVFGVFGLGFFVYFVGGSIDRVFFSNALPTPTFGTGGLLWAALTLALLTVPVVIVATEEALAAVPRTMREASVAMGATQFQTMTRVVLPAAAPGILTGVILAMARGAGEVAPLMITGVVKLAPELPVDTSWPFFHLERKFMHLGFHIYDVGFQSPNVEAAEPMVYTTTIFLLLIVVTLNIVAIVVRNRLRRKYRTSAF